MYVCMYVCMCIYIYIYICNVHPRLGRVNGLPRKLFPGRNKKPNRTRQVSVLSVCYFRVAVLFANVIRMIVWILTHCFIFRVLALTNHGPPSRATNLGPGLGTGLTGT